MNKKHTSKVSVASIFLLQVIHDYVCFIAPYTAVLLN